MCDIIDPRQWICFVCGASHNNIEAFCAHIIEKHEEGREYVLCPLTRCKVPVRDVRAHFAARHPNDVCPKVGQLKAIIWSDHKNPKKKKRPKFKEGYIISIKNDGKKMHYRSGYEKTVYECLELMDQVVGYQVEGIRIPYSFNGKQKGYYPDLLVAFTDSHLEILEIKPLAQCNLPINIAKWTACQQYCLERNWDFKVITESGIDQMKHRIIMENRKKNE